MVEQAASSRRTGFFVGFCVCFILRHPLAGAVTGNGRQVFQGLACDDCGNDRDAAHSRAGHVPGSETKTQSDHGLYISISVREGSRNKTSNVCAVGRQQVASERSEVPSRLREIPTQWTGPLDHVALRRKG